MFKTRPLLRVRLGFAQADDFVALFELPAFFEQFDALEALQNIAFRGDGACAFETTMLGHTYLEKEP